MLSTVVGNQFIVDVVGRLDEALERLAVDLFDVVLLDLTLPDSEGLETLTRVLDAAPAIPIIIQSGLADEDMAIDAVREGAEDYLVKGKADSQLLSRSIHYSIERKRSREILQQTALENARLYERERESRGRVQNYAMKLSLLHKVGITLNRESDKRKLLSTVLTGAAEITSAGVGALILIDKGHTDLVSTYYASWYGQRCSIEDDASRLHQRIGRLMPDREKNSARIKFDDLERPLELPEGHTALEGLLIGVIRDMRGNPQGYFMLSHKGGGGQFTLDDEEVIDLLAAQSSVALISVENFEREHLVAETLQEALIPESPDREGLEFGIVYRSASAYTRLGGDFYDFIELDGGVTAIAVGDVSGKGLEAATATAMLKYSLRAYVGDGDINPGEIMTRLNHAIARHIPMEKFITLGLAIIDPAKGTIAYSSAGHPPPVICLNGEARQLGVTQGVPLGVLPDYRFVTTAKKVTRGSSMLIYTDGLLEARPPQGEPFGEKRIAGTLQPLCGFPVQNAVDRLSGAATEYAGGKLKDDMALILVRLT